MRKQSKKNRKNFKIPERSQQILMTYVDLNSLAPVGSPVFIINELIDKLDTSDIESTYKLEIASGQKPIHPKTILKVSLYAIHSCRFSLRKMEEDTVNNLTYRWLTGDIRIDHSRFGRFLCLHKERIVELFSQVVMIAAEEGLLDFDILAIDSFKLRANASYKQEKNIAEIEKEHTRVKAQLTELIEKYSGSEEDDKQHKKLSLRQRNLESAKIKLMDRIDKVSKDKTEAERKKLLEKEEINITDHDAHKMQQRNGEINPGYSISIAVDTKSDIITVNQVNEKDNDNLALLHVIKSSENNVEKRHQVVVQDSGFSSISNLEALHEIGQFSLMPDKMFESDLKQTGRFARINFKYDAEKNCYVCPVGEELNYTSKYHDKNGRLHYRYQNDYACARCVHFKNCSKGESKTISRDSNEEIREAMRENLLKEECKEIYKKRAHSAECPTGHIKHNLKFKTVMRRGLDKIKMELSLISMLHNILKIGNAIFA